VFWQWKNEMTSCLHFFILGILAMEKRNDFMSAFFYIFGILAMEKRNDFFFILGILAMEKQNDFCLHILVFWQWKNEMTSCLHFYIWYSGNGKMK
jgi:hypothetical protein